MDPNSGVTNEIDPALRADPEVGPLVDRAAELLAEQAADTARPATASWRLVTDPRRGKRVVVRLYDDRFAVEVHYSASQIGLEDDARYLVIRLWGDLLEKRLKGLYLPAVVDTFGRLAGESVG